MSKFLLPNDRIPKPFDQNIRNGSGKLITSVGSCSACTLTKIVEVGNFVTTGQYTLLSKGYTYWRHNIENKQNRGMHEPTALKSMLVRGSVPESMCSTYDEFPTLTKLFKARKDLAALDKEAEKYKIYGWENISGQNTSQRFENIKEYLEKYNMPLAGTISKYKGEKHSVVIVGYEDDRIIFHNHDGSAELEKLKYDRFCNAYYVDCFGDNEPETNIESEAIEPLTEIDDIIEYLVSVEMINTPSMWLTRCKEDINIYWLCRKCANKLRGSSL